MGVVERLLTAGLVEIAVEDAHGEGARFCLRSYFAELDARFENGFDPGRSLAAEAGELDQPPAGCCSCAPTRRADRLRRR